MPTVSVKLHFVAETGKENVELSRILLGIHLNLPDIVRDHYRVLQSMGGLNIGEAEVSISDDDDSASQATPIAAEPAPFDPFDGSLDGAVFMAGNTAEPDLAEIAVKADAEVLIPPHGGFDPDEMSEKRIGWGGNAIASIMRDTGTDIEDALSDLLADLMHWSHANGQDFADELRRAVSQFEQETSEGGGW